ncbi:hypothetical protein [Paenibacillus naphthalenovorans]|uniref:hypothetical protein n=1 Tax=Paenibacillus naphthalenovorans TaxID=162209 RepID=UPI003D2D45F5
MPDLTPRLGIKKPLGTENVTRAAQNENYDIIDTNAAKKTDLDDHTAATTGIHGATSAATPNAIMQRDANGRAKVAAPVAADDIARKAEVDAVATVANAALPASSYTAADVLSKIKTVDGAGSGLDADTVRGYVPVNKAGDTITGDFTVNGAIRTRNGLDLIFIGDDAVIEDFDTANSIRIKGRQNPTIADIYLGTSNNRVWHTGMLRTTNGYLEVLIGGVWKRVGGTLKVQRGQATIPAASNTFNVTISSIADLTKAYIIISHTGFDSGIRATLTSATNLELYRNQTSGIDTLVTWQVIEHVN